MTKRVPFDRQAFLATLKNLDIDRRMLLKSIAAGSLLSGCRIRSVGDNSELLSIDRGGYLDYETDVTAFPLGIASGDPTSHSVVLWTAISPKFYLNGEKVILEVFDDRQLKKPLRKVDLGEATAESDFTLKYNLDGLEPFRYYFYRFTYGKEESEVGRCLTLPDNQTDLKLLRIAVITCQDYTTGYFHAFDHMANTLSEDQKPHFVFHTGDFIYEYKAYPGFNASQPFGLKTDRTLNLIYNSAVTLHDYRYLYRMYRRDRGLMQAMREYTWIISADDHEVADNAHFDYDNNMPGIGFYADGINPAALPYHSFFSNHENLKNAPRPSPIHRSLLISQKQASQTAWLNYVPTIAGTDSRHPNFSKLKIRDTYRSFTMGKLLHLVVTDSRSFRHREPCVEGKNIIENKEKCLDYKNPIQKRWMLGQMQSDWLIDQARKSNTNSTAWFVWGNQTLLSQCSIAHTGAFRALKRLAGNDENEPFMYLNYDAWDGYQAERDFILQGLSQVLGTKKNLVVFTGDMHVSMCSNVLLNYRARTKELLIPQNRLGIEFMTPALSSPNLLHSVHAGAGRLGGLLQKVSSMAGRSLSSAVILENNEPYFRYFDGDTYGFAIASFTREQVAWRVYHVDKNQKDKPPLLVKRTETYQGG